MGSDLAAIAWFFDPPYGTPAKALTPTDRAFVLGEASFGLRAQGPLQEALPAMWTGLQMEEALGSWQNAAIAASNLSETELLVGTIAAAATTAEKSVALADRAGEAFQMMVNRTTLADALVAGGKWEEPASLFADAERRQQEWQPEHPLLYSLRGYQYCDLSLSQGRAAEARDRGARTAQWARQHLGLLDLAFDNLTLGRAHLALALQSLTSEPSPLALAGC